MVAKAANDPAEESWPVFREGDAAWLVRQFGHYAHVLNAASGSRGGILSFPAGLGPLIGATRLPLQDPTQARRLLQLSNRQYQERLQNMQQLSAAHGRRMRCSARRQKGKRMRGCELGAESSSSSRSSSDGETAGEKGRVASPASGAERARMQIGNSAVPTAGEADKRMQKEESNPHLLAAYDLLTCTTGSISGNAATLPTPLLRFLSSQEQQRYGPTARNGKRPFSGRGAEHSTTAKAGAGGVTKEECYADPEYVAGSQPSAPGEAGRLKQ